MSVREIERKWIGSKHPVPPVVRAMWFLSSVIVDWRRGLGRDLRKATSDNAARDDVLEGLQALAAKGRTAEALLDELVGDR